MYHNHNSTIWFGCTCRLKFLGLVHIHLSASVFVLPVLPLFWGAWTQMKRGILRPQYQRGNQEDRKETQTKPKRQRQRTTTSNRSNIKSDASQNKGNIGRTKTEAERWMWTRPKNLSLQVQPNLIVMIVIHKTLCNLL